MEKYLWLTVLGVICLQHIHLHEVVAIERKGVSITSKNGDYVKEAQASDDIGTSGENGQSCDSHSTTPTGTLTSPNYPANYDNYLNCSSVIDLRHTGASSIGFHFNEFALEDGYDYLYYGEGGFVDWSKQLGTFNGHSIPPDKVVTGDQMWFYFYSDYSVTYRGFSITWSGLEIESTTAKDPTFFTTEQTTTDTTTVESTTLLETTKPESTTFAETTTEKSPGDSSEIGTVGTEFVLLFLPDSIADYQAPYVIINTPSDDPVQAEITVPGINFQYSTSVTRSSGRSVLLPLSVILSAGTEEKVAIVRASAGVTIHVMSYDSVTADGFLAVPTRGLGSHYVIASYVPLSSSYPSHFAIASLSLETNVKITTKQGQVHQITLPPYHSYTVSGSDDLTGSSVIADTQIVVVSGVECANVPHNIAACEHLAEQMISLENLGSHFHLAPFPSRRSAGYIYRVIATNPEQTTRVLISGGIEVDLEAGEFYEGNANGYSITIIQADNPVVTVQYMKGINAGDSTGDPAMILVPPVDLFSHNVTFPVFGYSQADYYHASVTIACEDASGIFLDDAVAIDTWYRLVSSDGTFCALQGTVSPQTHTIGHTNPKARFYVSVSSVGWCISYAYSAGFNLRSDLTPEPTPPATGVDCLGDSLTAYISRSLIGTVDGSHLHFLDNACVGTNHNNSHVELSTAFDACGTIMEVQDDYVVFSNVVQDEALPEPGQVITRDRTIEIPVECRMEKDGLSSISFHPDASKIVYSEEGYGKFSFNLQLYEDSSYVSPYPPEAYPIDVQLADMLYFEAKVSAEQGLELFVKECVATPTSEPTSTPQYEILEEGCPNDDTFRTFSSGDPMIQHFGLKAFAFVGSKTAIYVHCYLMLCNVTDPNSRSAQGCIAKSDVQKRSVAHTGSKPYVMSRGPIHFHEDTSNELNPEGESNAIFNSDHLAVLMCSIGFMVLCVVVSVAILKKSRKPDDSALIDGSED